MKNLYEPDVAKQVEDRLAQLKPDSPRQWGKMTPAQAVAHCSGAMEWAVNECHAPRTTAGRLLGWAVKPLVLRDDKPLRPGAPTDKTLVMTGSDRDLEAERRRLCTLIDRFVASGPKGCTTHPHAFFGRLTPDQWSILMYKHLDHHLRQFGV
jgi:hypothetical protein